MCYNTEEINVCAAIGIGSNWKPVIYLLPKELDFESLNNVVVTSSRTLQQSHTGLVLNLMVC